jgi:hypothetical protein
MTDSIKINIANSAKDDLIVALNGGVSAAVPLWELEFHAWNTITKKRVVFGADFTKLSAMEQDRALHINAEEMVAAALKFGYAALTVPGAYWELAPGEPSFYWLPPESRVKQIKLLKGFAGDNLALAGVMGALLGMPSSSSYVEFCYTLMDAPEQIEEMARNSLRRSLDTLGWMKDCGIEIFVTASDIADNRGPFYNPVQMQRFILPYARQWTDAVRLIDGYAFLHSDGDLMPCLNELCNCGFHAIQAIDPTGGMEMAKAKKVAAGRLCLAGNIDCNQLLTDSPDNIYTATKKLLVECKTGGGLILGSSNAVVSETPIENYYAMLKAWQEYGNYSRVNSE